MSIRRNAVAYVALFVALGGSAYAAANLPKNSVGGAQLRNGAVTNAKVKQHSLTGNVFVPGTIPAATAIATSIVSTPPNGGCAAGTSCPTSPAGATNTETATCPAGQTVVSGGYTLGPPITPIGAETVITDAPLSGSNGWQVTFALTQTSNFPVGTVYAVCAVLQ